MLFRNGRGSSSTGTDPMAPLGRWWVLWHRWCEIPVRATVANIMPPHRGRQAPQQAVGAAARPARRMADAPEHAMQSTCKSKTSSGRRQEEIARSPAPLRRRQDWPRSRLRQDHRLGETRRSPRARKTPPPGVPGRDERERCARKRSEAERVGCAKCCRSRSCIVDAPVRPAGDFDLDPRTVGRLLHRPAVVSTRHCRNRTS